MCYLIYLGLIGLFLIYSDGIISQYALAMASEDGSWMSVALGWEMLVEIWPVLVLVAVLASAGTFFIMRKLNSGRSPV